MKALTGFLKQLLSNGQIDQGGVDILMSHPGGQVVKALLGIDALAIPPQHTMDHKGVAQVGPGHMKQVTFGKRYLLTLLAMKLD
jgi:hypothetical protein